jgi:hypothetical protein
MVTAGPAAHSIGYVPAWTRLPARTSSPPSAPRPPWSTLTRRRAVDFCRVATALCRTAG